ncbi:hypothetical protein SS50377_24627 [Spironucleus salmonicida]|uniref:Uncharacterized protein n=1 Tax=Spironucleus salmonicida TaxID=348837 RepID=V6LIY0_9EUKA|nr:hypothetical protein SS50377_24627 [Spironucleus salmonicida]|eukprot:EST44522.1 Hypothetical protein SS50377_15520 [Spironucleus salmonicida]
MLILLNQQFITEQYTFNDYIFYLHYLNPDITDTIIYQDIMFSDDNYHQVSIFKAVNNIANIVIEITLNQINSFPCNQLQISFLHSSAETAHISNVHVSFTITIQSFKHTSLTLLQGSRNFILTNATLNFSANMSHQNLISGLVSNLTGSANVVNSTFQLTTINASGLIVGGVAALAFEANFTLRDYNFTYLDPTILRLNSWAVRSDLASKVALGGVSGICSDCLIAARKCNFEVSRNRNYEAIGGVIGAGKGLDFNISKSIYNDNNEVGMYLNKVLVNQEFSCVLSLFMGLYGEYIYLCE